MNKNVTYLLDRRRAIRLATASTLIGVWRNPACCMIAAAEALQSLGGVVGITTGGGMGRQRERGELDLLSVPKYVRDELGIQLIDVNSRWTKTYSLKELEQARKTADSAGCYFSNLKVNDNVGDLYSQDSVEKNRAMSEARKHIDAARILGTRWIRFTIPQAHAANPTSHIELSDEAARHGIKLLIENGGWMKGDPNSITRVVKAMGRNAAACPDTGNWDDDVREEGLRRSFVNAESCDFKVFQLVQNRQHAEYDLKKCFDIGWKAGFRGPWVIEYMKEETQDFARDTIFIRELLEKWIADSPA